MDERNLKPTECPDFTNLVKCLVALHRPLNEICNVVMRATEGRANPSLVVALYDELVSTFGE